MKRIRKMPLVPPKVLHDRIQKAKSQLADLSRVQTGVRLDAGMIERLRQGERGVSEEIRNRLERTFAEDALDPVLRELREGITNIAARLCQDFGAEWHSSPKAHEAFTAAVLQRLSRYRPSASVQEAVKDADYLAEPRIIGKLRESDDLHQHMYEHIGRDSKPER